VGFWSDDKITEDIDISWKLQMDHWDIQYIPQALCYIYMPETFKGLWKQRLRWAQGGVEVLLEYIPKMFKLAPYVAGNARSFSQHYLVICDDYDFYFIFCGICWIYRNNFKLIHSCRSGMA
jgi:cellulose synthase/poly-beta-1,6-N-acetylglucosamine synthase-like glycosyltransferase